MALKDKLAEAMNDEVEIDFSGAGEEMDFGPIPVGDYGAEVVHCEPGTSGRGNPKVVFRFSITDEGQYKGRLFFRHCPTKGRGSGIFRDTAKALGYDVEKLASGQEKFKCSSAIGRKAIITVRFQKDADDPEQQEVAKVKPLKSAGKATSGGRRSRLS